MRILLIQSHVFFLPSSLDILFPLGHFVTFSSTVILLSISLCLFLTLPHSAAPGSVSPFLGRSFFFPHILRKSSLFLLSSVDSPLTVMKQHSTGGFQRRKKDSKLHSLHYGSSTGELKRKWRAEPPLKWTPPGGLSACVACRKAASLSSRLLTAQKKLRVKWIIWQ